MTVRLPEIDAPGAGAEAGRAHGEAARELVGRHHALVLERLAARGVGAVEARDRAAPFRAAAAAVAAPLAAEVDGVGEGAGLTAEDGWLLQLRAELTIAPGADAPECTSVALGGPAPLAAQNVDLPPGYRPLLIALRRHGGHGPDLLTVTPAGQVGHHGMNAEGVTVFANFLHARGWRTGLPRYLLTRIALACRSARAAAAAVAAVPRSGPRNLLIADADGALALETTPDAVGRIAPEGDVLVHANHFESALAGAETAPEDWLRNSRRRAARMRALLAEGTELRAALADRDGVPDAISHHAEDEPDVDVETVASTVADIGARRLWVCVGPPDRGTFAAYAVTPA